MPARRIGASCRPLSSNLATVIGPVQQSLALTRPARWVAGLAMPSNLRDVPSDRLPTLDLARIFGRHAATHVVATIPLEPAAWIVGRSRSGCCGVIDVRRRLVMLLRPRAWPRARAPTG
jgi:hypothetical protein